MKHYSWKTWAAAALAGLMAANGVVKIVPDSTANEIAAFIGAMILWVVPSPTAAPPAA